MQQRRHPTLARRQRRKECFENGSSGVRTRYVEIWGPIVGVVSGVSSASLLARC